MKPKLTSPSSSNGRALKHLVLTMDDNFDDELEDFADYGPKDIPKVAQDPKPYNA